MKLLRPYIPLEVRIQVVRRQLLERAAKSSMPLSLRATTEAVALGVGAAAMRLDCLLKMLFPNDEKYELDHHPALENRIKVYKNREHVGYDPPANDPDYLIYREKHDHHLKTNVRGDGAQYPDRVLAKRERRRQGKGRRSRPLKSANRWPPKGSRKIARRVK